MSRRGVSGWMFLLVPAHLGSPRQRAVKRLCVCVCVLHNSFMDRLVSKFAIHFAKYPTTFYKCHYITLWKISNQKLPCSTNEWSELPCKTSLLKNIVEKYFCLVVLALLSLLIKRHSQLTCWKPQLHATATKMKRCHGIIQQIIIG